MNYGNLDALVHSNILSSFMASIFIDISRINPSEGVSRARNNNFLFVSYLCLSADKSTRIGGLFDRDAEFHNM